VPVAVSDLVASIASYENYWYLFAAVFTAAGFTMWIALSAKVKAHVRGVGLASFFLFPWFPKRMIIIGRRVYYDDEVEIIKGDKGYHIITPEGVQYTTDMDPDRIAIVKDPVSARGPEGVPAPFSLAWRWIVASSIVVYGFTIGLYAAWADPRVRAIEIARAFGYDIPADVIVQVMASRAENLVFAALTAAAAGAWWLANMFKMKARSIRVSTYIPIETGTTMRLLPALDPDSRVGPVEFLSRYARLKLDLADNVRKMVEKIGEKLDLDPSTVVQILNRAAMAEIWRMELGNRLKEYEDVKKAAMAECKLQAKDMAPRVVANVTKLLAIIGITALIVGLLVGYGLGAVYGVPAVEQANASWTPPFDVNVTIEPAPMPTWSPPGGVPVEPAPMPTTPPFDVNVTIEPAPMPTTPPFNATG